MGEDVSGSYVTEQTRLRPHAETGRLNPKLTFWGWNMIDIMTYYLIDRAVVGAAAILTGFAIRKLFDLLFEVRAKQFQDIIRKLDLIGKVN